MGMEYTVKMNINDGNKQVKITEAGSIRKSLLEIVGFQDVRDTIIENWNGQKNKLMVQSFIEWEGFINTIQMEEYHYNGQVVKDEKPDDFEMHESPKGDHYLVVISDLSNIDTISMIGFNIEEACSIVEQIANVLGSSTKYFKISGYMKVYHKNGWHEVENLNTNVKQSLGFNLPLEWVNIPDEIVKIFSFNWGNYGSQKSDSLVQDASGKSVIHIGKDTQKVKREINFGHLSMYKKDGNTYLYFDKKHSEIFGLAVALGVIDLSKFVISNKNEIYNFAYKQWLKENDYASYHEYAGIGNKIVHNFQYFPQYFK